MGRRTQRPNRAERRRSSNGSDTQIEFPGVMGWLQQKMKWFFIAGIVLLIASLGAPIFLSAIGSNSDSQVQNESPQETTPMATQTSPAAEPDEIIREYASEPEFQLTEGVEYEAVIVLTDDSEIRVQLLRDKAPNYVNNFVFLANNRFFDGLTFHRVIAGFVAQGGDPYGTGFGGPGYILTEEYNDIYLDAEGLLSMATSSAGVSGSQFFITLAPTPWLTGDFTVFGRVVDGMDVLYSIQVREPGEGQPPAEVIKQIKIIEN